MLDVLLNKVVDQFAVQGWRVLDVESPIYPGQVDIYEIMDNGECDSAELQNSEQNVRRGPIGRYVGR